MIDEKDISELVSQYVSHGWKPVRILLTKEADRRSVERLTEDFKITLVIPAVVDAIWFVRPNGEMLTWEIRRISGPPFALLRSLPIDLAGDEIDKVLAAAESELAGSRSTVNAQT